MFLFDLGQAPTQRLAVIMLKREPAPIDNRQSLYERNPVFSAGVERIGLKNTGGVMDKCVLMLDTKLWLLGPDGDRQKRTLEGENLNRALDGYILRRAQRRRLDGSGKEREMMNAGVVGELE
ncbi:hypothetical protein TNCV_1626021 [Trichonephila clavipes]|nr:hypothetical protein TNCV_1626021 [Trichonephila clavipes]